MSVIKVTQSNNSPDGIVAGTYEEKLYLNLMIYEVELPGEHIKQYAANVISENMLAQVYSDVFYLMMLNKIIYYQKDKFVGVPKASM